MRRKIVICCLVVLVVILCSAWILTSPAKPEQTLVLLHIMFRHGDRTPIPVEIVNKNSLYLQSKLYPYGPAELTLKGKRRMYGLGKAFRERYSSFLGDLYFDDLIGAFSSNFSRTVVSLQCVLAAIFPPNKEWEIEEGLMWQPAYFTQLPFKEDKIIAGTIECKKGLYSEIALPSDYNATLKYVEEQIGRKFTTFMSYVEYEDTVQVLEEFGFEIPAWTKPIRSEMREMLVETYSEVSRNYLPIVCGKLLQKINEDTVKKINGSLLPQNRKLFLYSGHDLNIIGLLRSIGGYKKQKVPYGSYIAIEIHEIDKIPGVKMFFGTENSAAPELLWIENCGNFCPLDRFIEITSKLYPPEPWCS